MSRYLSQVSLYVGCQFADPPLKDAGAVAMRGRPLPRISLVPLKPAHGVACRSPRSVRVPFFVAGTVVFRTIASTDCFGTPVGAFPDRDLLIYVEILFWPENRLQGRFQAECSPISSKPFFVLVDRRLGGHHVKFQSRLIE